MNRKLLEIFTFLYQKEHQKLKYLILTTLIFTSRLFMVISPWVLTKMIDNVKHLSDINLVITYLAIFFACKLLGHIFFYLFDKKFVDIGMRSAQTLINLCLNYYISNIHEKKSNGIINAELARYRTNIFNFYSFSVKHFLPISIELIISIVFCFFVLGWEYSTIILVSTSLFFMINHYWNIRQYVIIKARDSSLDKTQAFVEDTLKNKTRIFQNNTQDKEIINYQDLSETYIDDYSKAANCQIISELQKNITILISLSLMIGLLFFQILHDNKTVGDLLLLITVTTQVFSALSNGSYIFTGLMNALPTMESLMHTVKKQVVVPEKIVLDSVQNISIELNDFSMILRKEKFNLQNINLNIEHGQKVAIIGNSGSGKSTLLKAIYGLYHTNIVDSDTLAWYLNNNDSKVLIPYSNRKNYATFINQTPTLFNKTIAYNLLYGIEHANKDEFITANFMIIDEVLTVSGFKKIMDNRGLTLTSEMNEKNSFSGGEMQKLFLANTLLQIKLQHKSVIFFDEFSSAIDKITEFDIINNIILKYLKEYTIIMVSHNISTLSKFDKIVVMKQGKIIDKGNHDELMISNDFYKQSIELKN